MVSSLLVLVLFQENWLLGLLGAAGSAYAVWRAGKGVYNKTRESLVEMKEAVDDMLEKRSRPQRVSCLPDVSEAQWRHRLGIKMPGLV